MYAKYYINQNIKKDDLFRNIVINISKENNYVTYLLFSLILGGKIESSIEANKLFYYIGI